MRKNRNATIIGDNAKSYRTTNYSFSDVGKKLEDIKTPARPTFLSKDFYTTTEW